MSLAARAAGLSMWVLDLAHGRHGLRENAPAHATAAPGALVDFAGTLEHIHAPDRDRVEEVIRGAVASGEDFDIEYRIVAADGSLHWQSARGRDVCVSPVTDLFDVTEALVGAERLFG